MKDYIDIIITIANIVLLALKLLHLITKIRSRPAPTSEQEETPQKQRDRSADRHVRLPRRRIDTRFRRRNRRRR